MMAKPTKAARRSRATGYVPKENLVAALEPYLAQEVAP
jgi:hypothetical protein